MKYFFVFFFLIFTLTVSAAEKPQPTVNKKKSSVAEKPQPTVNKKKSSAPSLVLLDSEGGIFNNLISQNQKGAYPRLSYIDLIFRYSKSRWEFVSNISIESLPDRWPVGFDELSLTYRFKLLLPLEVKLGWMTLPLGYRYEDIHFFSKELSLYNSLSYRREDSGITLNVYLWKEFVSFQLSQFSGWFLRESDQLLKEPKKAPFTFSLKSRGMFWDLFVTYFENNPAFSDSLRSLGAGGRLYFSYKKLQAEVQSEFWGLKQTGQTTLSYYVSPRLSLSKVRVALVFGDINKFSPHFDNPQVQSSLYEKVFQVAYQLHPAISVMGERFMSRQRKGPFTNNHWAVRVKVQPRPTASFD